MTKKCNYCCESNLLEAKFCSKCGRNISNEKKSNKASILNTIILFYVSIIVFLVISSFLYEEYPNDFEAELFIELFFILIILVFSLSNFNEIVSLYKFPKVGAKVLLLVFIIPVLTSLSVYFFVSFINLTLYSELSDNIYISYTYLNNPMIWSIIFVAILPPIFEELAFRGYLYNLLGKITSEKMTIIATAALFALVHFSFLSILWIFPFGLFLGYLRKRYKTLWLGMIVHFIHNLIVLLLDYYNALSLDLIPI